MKRFHMKHPEILSTEIFSTRDGIQVLYAIIKFKTRALSMTGAYAFFDKNGKRLFIAGYNEDGLEPLERIMKSLTFK